MNDCTGRFCDDFPKIVQQGGNRCAIVDLGSEQQFTYHELASLMARFGVFYGEEAGPSGVIMTMLPNSVTQLAGFFGAIQYGFAFAPLALDASPREVQRWINLVKPSLCLVDHLVGENILDAINEAGIKLVSVPAGIEFSWLPDAENDSLTTNSVHESELFLTTSGSTGDPRALVFDANRLWASGQDFIGQHPALDQDARFFNLLPMFYLGGLFNLGLIPIACGGSIVIAEPFSGAAMLTFWQRIFYFQVNVLWLVPSIVSGLARIAKLVDPNKSGNNFSLIRLAFLGTAPISLGSKQQFESLFGIPLLENYALSETTFLTSEQPNTRSLRIDGSVGEVLPSVQLSFRSVTGDTLDSEIRNPTEILIKTPYLFLGYLQEDGSRTLHFDDNGFFCTGDLGYIDKNNTLVVNGRLRDFIKKGGFFVSLREVEVLAEQFSGVQEAVAASIQHDFYGEDYILYLRLAPDQDERQILPTFNAWLRSNLMKYKWPNRIQSRSDFPRTSSGKVRKHLINK
jgi:acyl-CoA synthetase (AMP-forming)/AMP-acid ligase II